MKVGDAYDLNAGDGVKSQQSGAGRLKIVYAAGLTPNDFAQYRVWALERLGHTVVTLNTYAYTRCETVMEKIAFRLAAGPAVNRLNRDLLRMVEREKPDVVWTDKMLGMQPATLKKLRAMGVTTVSYMIDNPFGTRRDPGWRLYMKDISYYDLHVVQRDANIVDYKARGARDVIKIQTAYEPTIHFAPPVGWSDAQRDREVSFVGTPYDNRAEFLTELWRRYGVSVAISGSERLWKKALAPDAFAAMFRAGELFVADYREAIWRSKINLSFVTHANEDEFVHKSFEIAGCGSFLLAERTAGHSARFEEDQEAVFFSTLEECAEKIKRWLPDEAGRARVAAAGCERAARDGYHNDRQVELIVDRLRSIVERP
ncbi:MAG TPA: glycosyltransferase [Acidobacteriaceae bacterium]|nr:glycosyltransferase [Acidobacteriaceae bacterium]